MMRSSAGARSGLRWGAFALAVLIAFAALGADQADARRRKKVRAVGYHPPYAAIVVDANSGEVMHAKNADALRHPASLAKVMTLYLLFEQLEAGKLRLDSELRVSAHAASQAPSRLGVRPGQTIEVEDAIKALVTKSANDVAVVIGEAIAGDEEDFAKLMTRKARALGMSRTIYTNASGLPDPEQVTTARDQARLGRAIQDRFPKYYRYFSTARFHYRGRVIGNHNRLLGRVRGVDGIKTGYVRASGFNLISSMHRGGRHIVAVVMGGTSGRARDARMRSLLEQHIVEASLRRTAPRQVEVADASPRHPVVTAQAQESRRAPAKPLALRAPAPKPGSADPIKPVIVRTMSVRRGPARGLAAAALTAQPEAAEAAEETAPRQVASAGSMPSTFASEARASHRAVSRGEWVIQVGAFPAETQAQDRLKEARSAAARALASAEPFTERVIKGETTLFRARFAGFDKSSAQAACHHLKRSDIACFALRN